jgi:hypothetical protein
MQKRAWNQEMPVISQLKTAISRLSSRSLKIYSFCQMLVQLWNIFHILNEKHKLQMFENKVVNKIFGL